MTCLFIILAKVKVRSESGRTNAGANPQKTEEQRPVPHNNNI